jgi:hypothetical protein
MSKRLLLFLISLAAAVPVALALDAENAGEAARTAGPYATIGGGALVIVGVLVYFLPTFIAGARRMESFPVVLLVDFLFGWTGIGWLLALMYSIRTEPDETRAEIVEEHPAAKQSYGR